MNDRMRIGDVTERAGVTPRTVRYYESIGLIPPGEREGHGQHYYTEETLARLRKIDQLKKLGLSLDAIPLKDVGLFRKTAQRVETPTPVASLLHDLLRSDGARA